MTGGLKKLSANLTSYDLLKTFAVLLMLVDHTGYYFYEDDNWWRVFGRFCVPVWFFLIGYARSRDIGPRLWIGAVILIAATAITGMGLIPVNILGTMIIIRLVIDAVMARTQRTPQGWWQVGGLLILLAVPSAYLFDYGTLAIIMAMFGWFVRHQSEIPEGKAQMQRFFFFSLGTFIILQTMFFAFKDSQIFVFSSGILVVMVTLMFFRPITFSGTGEGLKGILTAPLRFLGRRTLEIYVAHLLIFKAIGLYLYPERFKLFDWKIIPDGMLTLTVSGV